VGFKAETARKPVGFRGFPTQKPAKFAEKICAMPYWYDF